MRIYQDVSNSPDEWQVTSTLTLRDDGTFLYDELWTTYLGSAGGGVEGRWWRDGAAIVLLPERKDGSTYLQLPAGQERRAVENGDVIDLGGGWTLRRTHPAPATPAQATPPPDPPASPPPPAGGEPRPGDFPRAQFITPNPWLARQIQGWIDAIPLDGAGDSLGRVCARNGALPLHATSIYLWGIRPDGTVISIDHESARRAAEVENDPLCAFAALAQGAKKHPLLRALLPPPPAGVVPCDACGGAGWTRDLWAASGTGCTSCAELGWHFSRRALESQ